MRVYEASTLISAEFGGIRDLSRHLSLNWMFRYLQGVYGHFGSLTVVLRKETLLLT